MNEELEKLMVAILSGKEITRDDLMKIYSLGRSHEYRVLSNILDNATADLIKNFNKECEEISKF